MLLLKDLGRIGLNESFVALFHLELFKDGLVDDGASLLQKFDTTYEVMVLKVTPSERILVLLLQDRVVGWSGLLVSYLGWNLVHHVDSDKICHFCVHYFIL